MLGIEVWHVHQWVLQGFAQLGHDGAPSKQPRGPPALPSVGQQGGEEGHPVGWQAGINERRAHGGHVPAGLVAHRVQQGQAQLVRPLHPGIRDLIQQVPVLLAVVTVAGHVLLQLRHLQQSKLVHQPAQLGHQCHVFGHVQGLHPEGWVPLQEPLHVLQTLNVLVALSFHLKVVHIALGSHTNIPVVCVPVLLEESILCV
mmetsp:Transcript_19086/g.27557  ORF Transcript_19086/g.27557 Transcript_19086/m.27557 type:complete len:200 (+) Transcript_19086:505-1104(+)